MKTLVGQCDASGEIDLKHADGQCVGQLRKELFTSLKLLLEAGLVWIDLPHGAEYLGNITVVESVLGLDPLPRALLCLVTPAPDTTPARHADHFRPGRHRAGLISGVNPIGGGRADQLFGLPPQQRDDRFIHRGDHADGIARHLDDGCVIGVVG